MVSTLVGALLTATPAPGVVREGHAQVAFSPGTGFLALDELSVSITAFEPLVFSVGGFMQSNPGRVDYCFQICRRPMQTRWLFDAKAGARSVLWRHAAGESGRVVVALSGLAGYQFLAHDSDTFNAMTGTARLELQWWPWRYYGLGISAEGGFLFFPGQDASLFYATTFRLPAGQFAPQVRAALTLDF